MATGLIGRRRFVGRSGNGPYPRHTREESRRSLSWTTRDGRLGEAPLPPNPVPDSRFPIPDSRFPILYLGNVCSISAAIQVTTAIPAAALAASFGSTRSGTSAGVWWIWK
jgi:hypothetical protein